MHRFFWLVLFAAAASAQDNPFTKAPAEVDQALRARITQFFDYHVKGQFRKAEELVAEDTKDFFYSHDKPQYLSFEISRIDYSPDFKKAKATVVCEQYVMMPGFSDKPLKVPTPSNWKLENGQWYWYVDMDALRQTPWGKMVPGPPAEGSARRTPPSLANINMSPDFLFTQIKVEKQTIEVAKGGTATLSIHNTAPGVMELSVPGSPKGVEASLAKSSLQADEKTLLTVKAGEDAKSGTLNIQVAPTGQIIPIQVTVK